MDTENRKKETVLCMWCGTRTQALGAEEGECDNCWELRTRIQRWPNRARKIFDTLFIESRDSTRKITFERKKRDPWIRCDLFHIRGRRRNLQRTW